MSMKKIASFVFFFLAIAGVCFAQSDRLLYERINKVRELYEQDLYAAVIEEVDRINAEFTVTDDLKRSELEAFKLFANIKLEKPNIDGLVMEFEDKYQYDPQLAMAKFYQSSYYFNHGNYSRALEILNSISDNFLPRDTKIEFIFNRAYSQMRVGRNDEAVAGFEKVLSLKSNPFTASSIYYLAYIHYINKDFEKSIKLFEKLVNDIKYSTLSRFFLTESHLMIKDYDYVISYGNEVYYMVDDELKGKVARMLSEAYFAENKPNEAKKYFEMYSKSRESLSRKDNYYLGIVSYTLHSYLASIDAFAKAASPEDSLGQSAYYHLGNAYLQVKNKHSAMNAFKNASMCPYDNTIAEESLFLYSKLLFDVNHDISSFEEYLTLFPSSLKSDEIYSYIGTSYLLNKNYKSAITALNRISKITPAIQVNLQKAAFLRAMQLFERGAFRGAITDYKIAIKNGPGSSNLTLLSQFWLAEAYFRSNDFNQAVKIGEKLLNNSSFKNCNEYPLEIFNLGYAYFRLSDFQNSILLFKQYLDLSPSKRGFSTEAKTRLADSYFMLKEYDRSSELYNEVVLANPHSTDIYPSYQGAISLGLLSQDDKKIELLKSAVNDGTNSPLFPMAMYELGRTYVRVDNYDEAVKCFQTLMRNDKDTLYLSKALLEMGMLESNREQYESALRYFERIVETMPMSEDYSSAIAGMESIYQTLNRPEDFISYIDKIGKSALKTADEKETMLFNSAEQIFLSNNYAQANKALSSFIEKYPDGAKTAQAYFYLGETLINLNKKEAAADAFHKVMNIRDESFAELSTLYYARLSYELEKYDQAIEAFESLSVIARLENNKGEALLGKMRSYYHNGNYEKAIENANKVLSWERGKKEYSLEAKYITAKSFLALNQRESAIPILKEISDDSISAFGAEAKYLLILDAYDEGEFDKVREMVYDFSDTGTSQLYWLAKSFIVLGDSFAEQNETEQALATFQSIKEGYTPVDEHDDVLEQVEMRLKKL